MPSLADRARPRVYRHPKQSADWWGEHPDLLAEMREAVKDPDLNLKALWRTLRDEDGYPYAYDSITELRDRGLFS